MQSHSMGAAFNYLARDINLFARYGGRLTLREYQKAPAQAIIESVLRQDGKSLVVLFPRQSGKNEVQAQVECYLLCLLNQTPSRTGQNLAHLASAVVECHAPVGACAA